MAHLHLSTRRLHLRWRGVAVFVLAALGILALLAFSIAHWTERQLLTTDNYVKIVAPLPKDDQVATALSDYTVNTLFSGINVQQKISDALPPKADFLAPTLATQLKTAVTKGTKNIIQSDRFQSIWITANTRAHQRLMAAARNTSPPAPKQSTKVSLNLSELKDKASAFLGKNGGTLLSNSSSSASPGGESIGAKIKTSIATFGKYVRAVDYLNGVLGWIAVMLLLGAVVVSYHRRRIVMTIGVAILIVGLLQLISVKVVRPDVLNQVQNAAYRPAVGVIYDGLVKTFNHTATVTVILGAVIWLLAYLSKPAFLSGNNFIGRLIRGMRRSRAWEIYQSVRLFFRTHLWQIIGGIAILTLAILAFAFNSLNGQELVRAVIFLLLVIEFVSLVAIRPRRLPMEQAGGK